MAEALSLIVGWEGRDMGKVGVVVLDFLREKLGAEELGELDLADFLSFGGAAYRSDVIREPLSKFWISRKLLLFKSVEPEGRWYEFLNKILDFAASYGAAEVCTVSGTAAFIAHTEPRRLLFVINRPDLRESLLELGAEPMEYEGPPAISSYLIWVARMREMPGISFWPQVPFYLAPFEDLEAAYVVLSLLDRKFDLSLDLSELEEEIGRRNEKLVEFRKSNPEVDRIINKVERREAITEEEQHKLLQELQSFIRTS